MRLAVVPFLEIDAVAVGLLLFFRRALPRLIRLLVARPVGALARVILRGFAGIFLVRLFVHAASTRIGGFGSAGQSRGAFARHLPSLGSAGVRSENRAVH